MSVACLAGGDDQHAVVGFVLQVKEPQQGVSQLGTVGSGTRDRSRTQQMLSEAAIPARTASPAETLRCSSRSRSLRTRPATSR
jgi:hypothetical protein